MQYLKKCKLHFEKPEKWAFFAFLYHFEVAKKCRNTKDSICVRENSDLLEYGSTIFE